MSGVWKRKDRDVWVADFRDAEGKRKRPAAATRDEAELLLADMIRKVEKERNEDSSEKPPYWDYTLSQYVPVFLDRAKEELEEKTRISYQQNLFHHIVPVLGHVLVREIKVSHVRKLLTEKRKARYGVKPGHAGKPYSKTALRLMKAALSSLLTDAVEIDDLLKMNPALSLTSRKKRNRVKASDPEVNAMTLIQRDAFLTQARLREENGLLPYRLRVMWELRAKTGIRPEEAYALNTGHLNLDAKTIRIKQAVSLGQIKLTKTEHERDVDLSGALIVTLEEYIEFVKAEGVAAGLSEPYLLFPGRDGGLVEEADERWHRDLFKQVLSGAKLPGFVPYDLRHTFASILLSNNVPLLYVSKQLGHSKPTTTLKHYAKWLPKDEERFVDVLDTQLDKLGTKSWHQVDIIGKEEAEVVERFGGPCRGRTYGPLMKSQRVISHDVASILKRELIGVRLPKRPRWLFKAGSRLSSTITDSPRVSLPTLELL